VKSSLTSIDVALEEVREEFTEQEMVIVAPIKLLSRVPFCGSAESSTDGGCGCGNSQAEIGDIVWLIIK